MSLPPVRVPIEAKDNTGRAFRSATRNVDRFGGAALRLAGQLGVLGGAAGFGLLVKSQLRVQDELTKTARKLDITNEALAGYRVAGEQLAGVSAKTMDTALQRLTRRLSEAAAGTGEAQGAIKELGLDAQELGKLSLDQQFRAITDSFQGVESQADKVRLAFKLFDTEGVALVNVLNQGTSALDESAAKVRLYGTALDSVRAAEVEAANDALSDAKAAVQGLGTQLAASLAPGLASSAAGFADLVASITNTALPAFKLLAEQIGLVNFNVRGLSTRELEARIPALTDTLDDATARLEEVQNRRGRNRAGGVSQALEDRREATARLQEVEAELARRRAANAEADRKAADAAIARTNAAAAAARTAAAEQQAALDKVSADVAEREAKRAADAEARKAEAEQAAFESRLEQLQFNSLTLEEQEIAAYENRLGILQRALDQELVTRDQYQKLVLKQAQQTQDRLQSLQTTSSKAQTSTVAGGLQNIAQVSEKAQRTLFENNKSAQISNAVVNTAAGVTQALAAYPPPISFVMAALQAAAGLKQISAIKSQGAKGGGSVPSISGGGAAAAAASSANQNAATNNQGSDFVPRAADQQITVNLVGIEDDGFYSGTQVRRLMGAFTEQIRDGAQTEFVEAVANG